MFDIRRYLNSWSQFSTLTIQSGLKELSNNISKGNYENLDIKLNEASYQFDLKDYY